MMEKEKGGNGKNTGDVSGGQATGTRRSEGSPVGEKQDESLMSQVQESGREIMSKSVGTLSDKTRGATSDLKSDVSSGLHTLADGLRQTSETFQKTGEENSISTKGARYIDDLAGKIENLSAYLERKDATELLGDIKGFAKRNPTVFVGGAFAVGFALSRLIQSSAANGTARGNAK